MNFQNITFPKLWNINLLDLGKGFVVTLISTALTVLYSGLASNAIPTIAEIKTALLVGLGTGISYLIKQLITGIPPAIEIDPAKTAVIDRDTKEILVASTKSAKAVDVRLSQNDR